MPAPVKLSIEVAAEATSRVLSQMAENGVTQTRALRDEAARLGVSEITVRRAIKAAGVDLSSYTDEVMHRRATSMRRNRTLVSMQEKQQLANRLLVMALSEIDYLEAEQVKNGALSVSESIRLARAQGMLERAIRLDEKLLRAGVAIEGWVTRRPDDEAASMYPNGEALLVAARERRRQLQREALEDQDNAAQVNVAERQVNVVGHR
jgi:hypothetical protein